MAWGGAFATVVGGESAVEVVDAGGYGVAVEVGAIPCEGFVCSRCLEDDLACEVGDDDFTADF